ncbi:MAG: hypothetical protein IT497_00930, partial [Ottowia sp.]|nr:hypothetical protein [Ottowia sp.]
MSIGLRQLALSPAEDTHASKILHYGLLNYTGMQIKGLLQELEGRPFSVHASALLAQVDLLRSAYETVVPKKLHMVWIGGLGGIQLEYMRNIVQNAQENSYHTTLWYDPEITLARTLGEKIRAFCVAQHRDLLNQEIAPSFLDKTRSIDQKGEALGHILTLQNLAYTDIQNAMALGQTFDEAAIQFMVSRLAVDEPALRLERDQHLESYQRTVAVIQDTLASYGEERANAFSLKKITADVFASSGTSAHVTQQRWQNYLLELGLRNNPAAASDLVRASVLYQHGGVYCDSDILPNLRKDIFSHVDARLRTYIEMHYDEVDWSRARGNAKYQAVLEQMTSQFPSREESLDHYDDCLDDIAQRDADLASSLRLAAKVYFDTHTDRLPGVRFFEPLDAIAVGPFKFGVAVEDRRFDFWSRNNNVLAAQPGSDVLRYFVEKLDDIYAMLRDTNNIQHPNLSNHLNDLKRHTRSKDIQEVVERSIWRAGQGLPEINPGVKTYLPKLPAFRLDGLYLDSRATIFASGPVAIRIAMNDYSAVHVGQQRCADIKNALGLHGEFDNEASSLHINLEGQWSEEAMKSSWLIDGLAPSYFPASSTNYDVTIIVQLDNQVETARAARFLNNKHYDKVIWIDAEKEGTSDSAFKLECINSVSSIPNGQEAKIRVALLGHSSVVGEQTKLSGFSARDVAKLLPSLARYIQWELDYHSPLIRSVERISLVGCDLAGDVQGEVGTIEAGFVADLFSNCRAESFHVHDITARKGAVFVQADGKKMVRHTGDLGEPTWLHGAGSATKYIFTQDAQSVVYYRFGENHIEGPLSYLTQPLGSAGPLGWGEGVHQKIATHLVQRLSQAITKEKIAHQFDHNWVPLLSMIKEEGDVSEMTWLRKDAPSVSRRVPVEDPIFVQTKNYLDQQLSSLKKSHAFIDDELLMREQTPTDLSTDAQTQSAKISPLEHAANAILAIHTLITTASDASEDDESNLGLALKLHGYLTAMQATETLANQGLETSQKLTHLLLSDENIALKALTGATKFGNAVGHVVGPIFNVANLGFDITEVAMAQGTEQAAQLDTQLGFDVAMTATWVAGLTASTLGFDAAAAAAGPIGWALLGVNMLVMMVLNDIEAIKHAREQRAAVNQYVDDMVVNYRDGGTRFDQQNRVLTTLPYVIVTRLDLVQGDVILDSATLCFRDGLDLEQRGVSDLVLDNVFYVPIPVLDQSRDGIQLSAKLQLPSSSTLVEEALNQTRIVVLPITPKIRFAYSTEAEDTEADDYSSRLASWAFPNWREYGERLDAVVYGP